jgi:DNA recombination protein RmuC
VGFPGRGATTKRVHLHAAVRAGSVGAMDVPTVLAAAAGAATGVVATLFMVRGWLRPAPPLALVELPARLDAFATALERSERTLREEVARLRGELGSEQRAGREETAASLRAGLEAGARAQTDASRLQGERLEAFSVRLGQFSATLEQSLERVRTTVDARLLELQNANAAKLDQIRATVEEKLQSTLERRLGESFKLVSERLEQVHRGLGEMQTIAAGVGDLRRVLTNVKSRGTWGEVQLGALLEETVPGRFERNVATRPNSAERVEFALRLPGRADGTAPVLLPIDAKFPVEDYLRLVEAAERADAEGVAAAGSALETRVRQCARDIRDKYVAPPHTTDFAILFLPSEGLYAEVLRRTGLAESLQRDLRVVLSGPTTLTALLNSLQMGFRTLAIEQRASEVWQVLGAVKTEFGKFGETLDAVKKKLEEASNKIDATGVRSRAIERKLRSVEAVDEPVAQKLLTTSEE